MAEASLTLAYMPGVTPAKWLRVWAARHPREAIERFMTHAAEQTAVLHDGRADLCLVRLPIDDDGLHVIPLYEEVAVIVVPEDHPFADRDGVQLGDLAGESVLDLPELDDGQRVEVVATGAGVALMPQSVARLHARKDVRAIPVTDAPTTRIALAWRRDDASVLIDDFIGVVRGRTAQSSRGADAAADGAAGRSTGTADAAGEQRASKGAGTSKGTGSSKGSASKGSASKGGAAKGAAKSAKGGQSASGARRPKSAGPAKRPGPGSGGRWSGRRRSR